LAKIINIATEVPPNAHPQQQILSFMNKAHQLNDVEARKLRMLYHASAINQRHSVIADYGLPPEQWQFYNPDFSAFPTIEERQKKYDEYALVLSAGAARNCMQDIVAANAITHLITVSCTGMSAPGLDLQLMEALQLPSTTFRTSVNFMGCYAAIHALKLADALCAQDAQHKVLVVCTELCTLHFQKEATNDNLIANMLFADGCAAMLVVNDQAKEKGLRIQSFYSEVQAVGKNDMSWQLGKHGFLMQLSGYVPDLIEADFQQFASVGLAKAGLQQDRIQFWAIHPGGKAILQAIANSMQLESSHLQTSYDVLANYGNMSSATILFVLQRQMQKMKTDDYVFAAAFGPGLTQESFVARYDG
jgi:predicted naringenin-chalcone synthase